MDDKTPTTDGGQEVTPAKSSVVDMKEYMARKREGREESAKAPWPSPTSPVTKTPDGGTAITASAADPNERKILISTPDGEIIMSGFLGLSQTFLAVGDARGQIKFACAPGQWLYATDITDMPEERIATILADNTKPDAS